MNKTISCSIGYHQGGMGQHFSQFVEDTRQAGKLAHYYTSRIKPGDEAIATVVTQRLAPLLIKWSPARFHPGWRWHVDCDCWDRKIAKLLPPRLESFVAFGGQALRSFQAAKKRGAARLELIAANTHVNNCYRLHQAATKLHPFEKPWLSDTHRKKTLAEYALADIIWIASEYAREMFTREGVSPAKLQRIHYATDPRYTPRPPFKSDGTFRVIYIGALTVCKGIPILIEAFKKLNVGPAELILIGGSSSRGMRRYLEQVVQDDPRIKLAPGDPLPHIQKADVCVHPSWEDNLAYAALEALRAGVPTVVTADTGMKEYIVEGQNGYVIPTGDVNAILEKLQFIAAKR